MTEPSNQNKVYRTIEQSVLAMMIAKYPKCFVSIDKVPKPLKIGIARDIITNELSLYDKPDNKEFMETRWNVISFLEWYENRRVYLNAITNNAVRIDLNGNEVESISERQKEYAKSKLFVQKRFNQDWNGIFFKMSAENKKEIFEILDFLLNSKFTKTEYQYPNVIPYYDRIGIIKGKLVFPKTYDRFDRYRVLKWIYTLFARRSDTSVDKRYFITGRALSRLYILKWIQTIYINISELREKSKNNYNEWAQIPLWSYQEFLLLMFGIDPIFENDFIGFVRIRFKTKIISDYERLFKITYRKFNNLLSDDTYPLPLDGAEEAKQKRIWLSKAEQTPHDLLKFAKEVGFERPENKKLYELVWAREQTKVINANSVKLNSSEIHENGESVNDIVPSVDKKQIIKEHNKNKSRNANQAKKAKLDAIMPEIKKLYWQLKNDKNISKRERSDEEIAHKLVEKARELGYQVSHSNVQKRWIPSIKKEKHSS